jgi:hypothetical protein
MSVTPRIPVMTRDQFFARAEAQGARYKFDGFEPVAMTGGNANHNQIAMNTVFGLRGRLAGGPCRPSAGGSLRGCGFPGFGRRCGLRVRTGPAWSTAIRTRHGWLLAGHAGTVPLPGRPKPSVRVMAWLGLPTCNVSARGKESPGWPPQERPCHTGGNRCAPFTWLPGAGGDVRRHAVARVRPPGSQGARDRWYIYSNIGSAAISSGR